MSSIPTNPGDDLLNKKITDMANAVQIADQAVMQRYQGKWGWLKDTMATAKTQGFKREEFTGGLGIQDERVASRFKAVMGKIETDFGSIHQLDQPDPTVGTISGTVSDGQQVDERTANQQAYLESVQGILAARPDHPAIAELARPNKDQTHLALALAAIAPNATASIATALGTNLADQRAEDQRAKDITFQQQLQTLDAELGLTEQQFQFDDQRLADESAERQILEAEGRQFKHELDKIKLANDNKLSQQETDLSIELLRGLRAGNRTPEMTRALAAEFGFSEEAVNALVGDESTRFDAEIAETMAGVHETLRNANLLDAKAFEIDTLLGVKYDEIVAGIAVDESLVGLNKERALNLAKETSLMDKEAATRRMNAAASYHNAFKEATENPEDKEAKEAWNKLRLKRVGELSDDEGLAKADIARFEKLLSSGTLDSEQEDNVKVNLAGARGRLEGIEGSQRDLNTDLNTALGIVDPNITSSTRGGRIK